MIKLRLSVLKSYLLLQGFGVAKSLWIILLVIGITGWQFGLPRLASDDLIQQQKISQLKQALTVPSLPVPVVIKDNQDTSYFYSQLGDTAYVEQEIKKMLGLASKHGVVILQADYQFGGGKNSKIATYQVTIPVKGSYPAIRQFCEQFLLATPFASLDNLSFKRDTISNNSVDTKLRFTLYLNQTPATSSGGSSS